jgi:regulatory protein
VAERKQRPTPPLSANWLRLQAQVYLQRYAASEHRLRQLLWKRVRRAQSFHGGTQEDAAPLVSQVLLELVASGLVNDSRFALEWALTLQKRGTSKRVIRHKLQEKGLAADHIDQALLQLQDSGGDWEQEAAQKYARRRRLGCFRSEPDSSWDRRQKDLASMARAGFGFEMAKRVLEG